LAQRCGVNKRQVQYDIEHLRDLGLIIDSAKQKIVKDEPMRTIETVWSRDTERHPTPCNPLHPPVQSIASPRAMDCTQVDTDREGKAERDCPPMSSKTNGALSSIKIDGWAKATAAKLRRLVTKEMNQITPYKASDWEKEFMRLRASLDGNEHVIDETLDWFSQNWRGLKGRFFSAKSFCKNFTMFLEMSKKEHLIHSTNGATSNGHTKKEGNVGCSNKRLTIPDDVREQLEDMPWKGGAPEGVEKFYAESHAAALRLIGINAELDVSTEEGTALDNFLYALGASSEEIALEWCRRCATASAKWRDWGGSLKPFRLEPDGWFFHDRLKATCGNVKSGTINRLLATLKREWA
jgi:hypothetical protein